jgi:hypothetical protein
MKKLPRTYIVKLSSREFLAIDKTGRHYWTERPSLAFRCTRNSVKLLLAAAEAQGLHGTRACTLVRYPAQSKVEHRRACQTTYLDPTDHRLSRVKGKHLATGRSITLSWDRELNCEQNHARAASELLGCWDLVCCSIEGGGYVWMAKD